MMPRSNVRSENTQAISGAPGLRPDILITAPGRSPVVIEAEYMPAHTVEPEARDRLGLEVAANGRIIEAAIAVRCPEAVSAADDLHAALSAATLTYCLFTEESDDLFPLVSFPQRAETQATETLQAGMETLGRSL